MLVLDYRDWKRDSASFFFSVPFLPSVSDIPTSWFCVQYVFDHQSSFVFIWQKSSDPDKILNDIYDETRSATSLQSSSTLSNHVEISTFWHFIGPGNDTLSAYQNILIITLYWELDESKSSESKINYPYISRFSHRVRYRSNWIQISGLFLI